MREEKDWLDEEIVELRRLWHFRDEAGSTLSTAEIGRRMYRSKSSIVGKAHRIGLEERPSPIRRGGVAGPKPQRSNGRPTLPPLASEPATAAPVVMVRAAPPVPRPVWRPPMMAFGRVRKCCWPFGEPGTRDFHFCSDASVPGKPYCEQHCGLAYVVAVPLRLRREDAA